jgi:L-aminopeptidase/D-esterase-like protein
MGYAACEDAFRGGSFQSGNFGAGTGATIGKARGIRHAMKGGIGAAAFRHGDLEAGAVVAVNCVGDIVKDGAIIAGALGDDRLSFADSERIILENYRSDKDFFSAADNFGHADGHADGHAADSAGDTGDNTVLGCIITNAAFDKAGATRLAGQGQNAIARVVRPAHSIFDGDTVFALCSGAVKTTIDAAGILCAAAVEAAIISAVQNAWPLGGYPALAVAISF